MTDAKVTGLIAIVPAAGIGSRMGADCPKQYLHLAGKTILEHTLERLLSHPAIVQVIVALAPHDRWFETLPSSTVVFADEAAFANTNTPEELQALEQTLHASN